jgi:hypothetical protein
LKACLEEKIKHRQHRPKIKVVRFVKMKKIVFICHTSTINETLFDGSVGAMGKKLHSCKSRFMVVGGNVVP